MAQDFESTGIVITNSETNLLTANSDDAIVSIRMANIHTAQITVDVYIETTAAGGSNLNCYLIKGAPIPVGSALELIDSGSKIVLQNGDELKVKSDTDASLNCWVSFVDAISE